MDTPAQICLYIEVAIDPGRDRYFQYNMGPKRFRQADGGFNSVPWADQRNGQQPRNCESITTCGVEPPSYQRAPSYLDRATRRRLGSCAFRSSTHLDDVRSCPGGGIELTALPVGVITGYARRRLNNKLFGRVFDSPRIHWPCAGLHQPSPRAYLIDPQSIRLDRGVDMGEPYSCSHLSTALGGWRLLRKRLTLPYLVRTA